MRRALCSLAVLALAVPLARAADIENPEYAQWAKYKKGTSITLKTTTTAAGMTNETLMTTTLLEVGDAKLVIETVTVLKVAGMEIKSPLKRDVPKTITVPDVKVDPKVKLPDLKPETGTETLKIAGLEVKTKWTATKVEVAGTTSESKTWTSEDVPGMLVKSETSTKGAFASTTKIELIEFKKP
jgi:hypothetical protein